MENSKVSICISTWNRKDSLLNALLSIVKQDYTNIEIIIVDNHSSDGTCDALLDFAYKYPFIDMHYASTSCHLSAMFTLNNAFLRASGDYILVLDDDAYLFGRNAITSLVEVMEKNPNAAIVGANVKSEGTNEWQMPLRSDNGEFLTKEEIDKLGIVKYFEFHGACALFNSKIVYSLGFYDESFNIYMNEMDLSLKAITEGYDVLFDADVIAYHMGVGDSTTCSYKVYRFIKNYNTVITRNFRGIFKRFKAVTLHTIMSGGYYTERILTYNICHSRFRVFKLAYYIGLAYMKSLYRCVIPDESHVFPNDYYQSYVEDCLYNGFKRCIKDRMSWITDKLPTSTKGIR